MVGWTHELFFDRKVREEEVYITWTFAPKSLRRGRATVDGISTRESRR